LYNNKWFGINNKTLKKTNCMNKKSLFNLLMVLAIFATACKKNDGGGTPASKIDLIKDSVFLYSKEVYLWEDKIPAYDVFNPRKYGGTTELATAQDVMNGIKILQPLDRFSFVTTKAESDGLQTGDDKDLGFFVKAAYIDKALPFDSVRWFVSYVYKNSSAGTAGVQRGWIINKINGTGLVYDNASINILNDVFFGTPTSASFEFTKPDGTTSTNTLTKTSFTANSVLYREVLVNGSKKVGYLVFNQFFGEPSRKELGEAFTYFTAQGINDLVVDLRYNRGGATQTQDTLANLIAPNAANGQVMYKYIFNNTLQQNKHTLIRKRLGFGNSFTEAGNTVLYTKAGSLNLSRVFIIATSSSASASELLINNLKPYMDVKVIGDTTYGKPVGFFPIPVYDLAIYPISFKTINSAGNAEYYSGFIPDVLTADGVNRNWGDVNEPSLAAALKYINTGAFRSATNNNDRIAFDAQQKLLPALQKMEARKFSGMFIEK
jgi:carboxyl-terminal processing protease